MKVHGFLCDSATVREGLLHVLGGGITRLWRGGFPAPMKASLALMIEMEASEIHAGEHDMFAMVIGVDGQPIASSPNIPFGVGENSNDREPGESLLLPMVIDMAGIALPSPGTYRIALNIDRQEQWTCSFSARTRADLLPPE